MNIVVTAGHDRSLGTIALISKLVEDGHNITDVIVVKTFRFSRFAAYLKQFGFKTVFAKFTSHYLQTGNSYLNAETIPIQNYLKSRQITHTSISTYCRTLSIPFFLTESLSSSKTVQRNRITNPDLVIYSGGGILTQEFISTSINGVLNAHSGPLPQIRGMNAIEWSIVEGLKPTTTIHLIDRGIDTGNVLSAEPIPENHEDTIYDLRGKAIPHNIALLSKVVNSFDQYNKNAVAQNIADGRQYFVMHRLMKECLQEHLKTNK